MRIRSWQGSSETDPWPTNPKIRLGPLANSPTPRESRAWVEVVGDLAKSGGSGTGGPDRKVEPARWVEFVTRDLLGPLLWLDENEDAIADGSLLQTHI